MKRQDASGIVVRLMYAFLPKKELLSLEEIAQLSEAFIGLGVRKIRITGGVPLVRLNVLSLFRQLSKLLDAGVLDELTLRSTFFGTT